MSDIDVSRRDLLTGVGAAGLGAITFGTGNAVAAGKPDEHIVGTSSRGAESAAKRSANSVKRVLDFGDIGKAVVGMFSDEAIDKLEQRDDVRYIEENGTVEALAQTTPWGVDRVDAEVANNNGENGSGADIAIIDTGIDSDHPDLQGNLTTPHKAVVNCGDCSCFPPGFCGNDNECHENWDDDNDHGSHVSGTAAAVDNSSAVLGVSAGANLHAVKVLDCGGGGTADDVAAGINWTADNGMHVANMSLGTSDDFTVIRDACQYAHDNGVLLVAAAGNDGPCTNCVNYPAKYSTVVAVSATTDSDSLADFSSTGSEVELAAPGESVLSTVPGGTDTFSGTSMASPHVAGAGGQIWDDTNDDDGNGRKNDEVRQQLRDTADDIGLGDNEQGNGLVDVAEPLGLDSSDNLLTVETRDATNVGSDSATLNGEVTELAGVGSTDVWFKYWVSGDKSNTATTTSAQTLSSTGSYSEDVTGLSNDTTYEFRAVADGDEDGTGDDLGSVLTFTTGSSSGSSPTVDSVSLNEDNSGGSPHADFDASWSVSDGDGDLDTVDLTLTDLDDEETEESASVDVSGSDASGTTSLKAKHEENSGHEYEVEVVVTDSNGNTASDTATEIEDGS